MRKIYFEICFCDSFVWKTLRAILPELSVQMWASILCAIEVELH